MNSWHFPTGQRHLVSHVVKVILNSKKLYLKLSTYFRDLIRKKLQVSHTKFECWNKREHPLTINLLILWYNSKVERPKSINLDTWLSVKSQFKLRECPWALWGLILCIILTGLRHAQIAGETLTLDVSMGVFLEEIIILISRLNKKDSLPQCGWASFKPLRAWIKQKGRGRVN